jgi:hypothetical protein
MKLRVFGKCLGHLSLTYRFGLKEVKRQRAATVSEIPNPRFLRVREPYRQHDNAREPKKFRKKTFAEQFLWK